MIIEDFDAPKTVLVEQATAADREIIVDSLTRAFWDDPMYNWLAKQDAYLGARFRRIFEAYWQHFAFPYEQIWTTEDRLGAALWSPPNCWQLGLAEELAFLPDWIAVTGLGNLYSRWRAIEKIQAKHPHTPHWYLMAVGVAYEARGQGYCSKLLRPVLDICDRTQTPAYLENSKAENTRIYERFGFKVTEELTVAKGVTLWLMWREPRIFG
jgi:ribosomal protein S18 acetylase RimI-like enzyme